MFGASRRVIIPETVDIGLLLDEAVAVDSFKLFEREALHFVHRHSGAAFLDAVADKTFPPPTRGSRISDLLAVLDGVADLIETGIDPDLKLSTMERLSVYLHDVADLVVPPEVLSASVKEHVYGGYELICVPRETDTRPRSHVTDVGGRLIDHESFLKRYTDRVLIRCATNTLNKEMPAASIACIWTLINCFRDRVSVEAARDRVSERLHNG
jgi:hypothetical protein